MNKKFYGKKADKGCKNRKEQAEWLRRTTDSDERLYIRLTNDFAFKKVFHNKEALTGLLSALLHVNPDEISDIEYKDTIVAGEYAQDKFGVMDLYIVLNHNRKVNIEIQVVPFPYWKERSLFYLSKMYVEDFGTGEGYEVLKECIHISILAFSLFEEKEFYSVFRLTDEKSGRVYSDKISLCVLQLDKLEQAGEEEQNTEIYRWARMIVAENWEELTAMANGNSYMEAAVNEMEKINSDKTLRYEYLRREIKLRDEATLNKYYSDKDTEIAQAEEVIAEKVEKIAEKEEKIAEKEEKIAEKEEKIAEKEEKIAEKEEKISEKEEQITKKEEKLAEEKVKLEETKSDLAKMEQELAKRQETIVEKEIAWNVMKLLLRGLTEDQIAAAVGIKIDQVRKIKCEAAVQSETDSIAAGNQYIEDTN